MRTSIFGRPCHVIRRATLRSVSLVAIFAIAASNACAEPSTAKNAVDPFDPVVVQPENVQPEYDPFGTADNETPVTAAAFTAKRGPRHDAKPAHFQTSAAAPPQQPAIVAPQQPEIIPTPPGIVEPEQPASVLPGPRAPSGNDPCAAARFRPMSELGIGIAQPTGQSPTDFATPCWDQINAGPSAMFRCWPVLCYQWDATNLCYRPLYFEDINAERYGYICNDCWCCCGPQDCLQSACSAAHFFGTVPALPYVLSAQPPRECVYTLGHYRPGSCAPWRCNYWPWDPCAALVTAGVYTGFVYAIP